MAVKGANSPFNICSVKVPSTMTDANGAVSAGPDHTLYFRSSRIYAEPEVAKRTGVTYIDADKWEGQEPLITVEQMILSKKLIRLIGEVDLGASKGFKQVSLLAIPSKASLLLGDVKASNLDDLNCLNNKGTSIGKFFNVRTGTRDRFS
jgi:hypothetical protein